MKIDLIPLPAAVPGREYMIDNIKNENDCIKNFRRYGLFSGAKIKFLFASPAGDPCAYEVLGTVLALRNTDSSNIYVKEVSL